MLTQLLFPAGADLQLEAVLAEATQLTFVVGTTTAQVACPLCGEPTTRRHSRYQRTLADVPCAAFTVRLELHTRRFFCAHPACPRRIFTERVPALAAPSARRTHRLTALLQQVGLALGGEAGTRLAHLLGLLTSATTLLRLIRQVPDPPTGDPQVVGIDDFAFRKGQTYGTILVDLETGQPLDLLPDRTAESVAAWLRTHPQVIIITRDRAEVYIEGATTGAPQATQVADRWHLLKNLSETLDEILTRLYPALEQALRPEPAPGTMDPEAAAAPPVPHPAEPAPPTTPTPPGGSSLTTAPALSRAAQLHQARRAQKLAQYEEVQTRRASGQSLTQIARELGLSRRTVRKHGRSPVFPERQARRPAASPLDPHKPYLRERWAAGCHNAAQLWREVRQRGYGGGYDRVYAFLRTLSAERSTRTAGGAPKRRPVRRREWTQRLGRPAAELTVEERAAVEQVCARSPVLGMVYDLVQRFGQMVRERTPEAFAGWLDAALASGVDELVRFAQGLQRDAAAVVAALTLPWSNGPVEGHVNRLKVLKRAMYGRAKFPLLRKRVLCAA
jgi:transposase